MELLRLQVFFPFIRMTTSVNPEMFSIGPESTYVHGIGNVRSRRPCVLKYVHTISISLLIRLISEESAWTYIAIAIGAGYYDAVSQSAVFWKVIRFVLSLFFWLVCRFLVRSQAVEISISFQTARKFFFLYRYIPCFSSLFSFFFSFLLWCIDSKIMMKVAHSAWLMQKWSSRTYRYISVYLDTYAHK